MKVFADLHIHSKYARACSKDSNLENLEKNSLIKGLGLVGTGDFTHPIWQQEMKQKLEEVRTGIFTLKNTKTPQINFMLQTEISLIYSQDGKGRRVHNIVFAPSFEVVDKITETLLKFGRVDYDGRPIFKIPCPDFVEMFRKISPDIEIIPAHCLLPDQYIHTNSSSKKINDLKKGENVLTHMGEFKKVSNIFSRTYHGKIFHIIPWYFNEGIYVTPEHPFYVIKTDKNCSWTRNLVCKPTKSHKRICYTKAYVNYKNEWKSAEQLEKGDIIVYPKIKEIKDKTEISIKKLLIKITPDFCRLIGYYLAEGYTNNRDAFCFTFNNNEREYIEDVKQLVLSIFGIKAKEGKTKGDIIFYSKSIYPIFQELFYEKKPFNASNKIIPSWMLTLPFKKQKELLRGWWRGDKGYTTSRSLANQMKSICLRMNIIPSIRIDSIEKYQKRGNHFIGKRDIKHGWFDNDYIYIPIRQIVTSNYKGIVYNLEVKDHNSYVAEAATVHNCWTPWFSLFGSNSGFNSVKDCFHDQTKYINAIETGLSSDPSMNWRLSQLDKINLVSFSDPHSFWPWRLGREATLFEMKENYSYHDVINAIRDHEHEDKNGLKGTIEVDPNYGKYHFDGHRNCGVSFSPEQANKMNKICPKCKQHLTIGVMNRVEELADRPTGFKPKGALPYYSLLPLSEIICTVMDKKVEHKTVAEEYYKLINQFGNEFTALMDTPEEQLLDVSTKEIVTAILKNRNGEIEVIPGYDGLYGIPIIDQSKTEYYLKKREEDALKEAAKEKRLTEKKDLEREEKMKEKTGKKELSKKSVKEKESVVQKGLGSWY